MARVVVGMDGSEESKRALRHAQQQARFRDAELEAIYVYETPRPGIEETLVDVSRSVIGGVVESTAVDPKERRPTGEQQARRRAHDRLAQMVEEAMEGSDGPMPHLVVLPGDDVVKTIIDRATGADLLVIGLRRRSPVGKLVLGSDARDILLRSPVPVLAVHDQDR